MHKYREGANLQPNLPHSSSPPPPIQQLPLVSAYSTILLMALLMPMHLAPQFNGRRNAIDYHSHGMATDYWHQGLPCHDFTQKPYGCPTIAFRKTGNSATPVLLGVAFSELEFGGRGVENGDQPLEAFVPPVLWNQLKAENGKTVTIHFDFPGYTHVKRGFKVEFRTTVGDFAARVVRAFKVFYDEERENFRGTGLRLGSGQSCVRFAQLRLQSVYFYRGTWQIEACYVPYNG